MEKSGHSPEIYDPNRIALSIRQPWAELILRGIKTIEVRRTPARPMGSVYLYTSKRISSSPELDSRLRQYGIDPETLPRGVIVGTVDILESRRSQESDASAAQLSPEHLAGTYSWVVGNAVRFPTPLPVEFVPFGTWFYPFQRKQTNVRHRRNHGGV
jgi:hypothetical protein